MQRCATTPRPNWEEVVQKQGLSWHLTDGRPYWVDDAYFRFTAAEIESLEKATYALNEMCLQAVEHVIKTQDFGPFNIPPAFTDWIKQSWERDEVSIYGRFDFAFDGGVPKLLEYNADTPTALLEAAVVQWFWFEQFAAGDDRLDQFNSIHDRLIEAWKRVSGPVYFSSVGNEGEDFITVSYLRDTAMQAGLKTEFIEIADIGWHAQRGFTDLKERPS